MTSSRRITHDDGRRRDRAHRRHRLARAAAARSRVHEPRPVPHVRRRPRSRRHPRWPRRLDWGVASTYSFYPTKVMTSGEGGMIVTDDERIADEARVYRDQGKAGFTSNFHTRLGANWRLSEPHAAIGLVQLKRLDEFIAAPPRSRRRLRRNGEAPRRADAPGGAAARSEQLLQVRGLPARWRRPQGAEAGDARALRRRP